MKLNRHGGEDLLLVKLMRDEDYIVVRNNILELMSSDTVSTGSG